MSNRSLSFSCEASASLSSQPYVHYLLLFKTLTCIPAVILPIFFLKIKGTGWLLNPNLKALFLIHLFWVIELPLTYFFVYMYDLMRICRKHENPCDYMVSTLFSLNTRILPILGLMSQMFTMFIISCDRLFSTLFPILYDNLKTDLPGILCGIVASVTAVALTYGMIFTGVNWDANLITYTLRTQENCDGFQILTKTEMVIGFVTICIFAVTLYHNERKRKEFAIQRNTQLANRYQVNENRLVIRKLLPICIIHAVFFTINGAGLSMYPYFFPEWSPISHTLWLECWGQMHVYPIVMSIVLFRRLRKQGGSVVDCVQQQDEYFATLKILFEKK